MELMLAMQEGGTSVIELGGEMRGQGMKDYFNPVFVECLRYQLHFSNATSPL